MTLQTPHPIEHTNLTPSARESIELVHLVEVDQLDLEPPYQRGPVWSGSQRMALIRSWLIGLPIGVIILSDRENPRWTAANGDVYTTGTAKWAAVDGKQRLLAAQAWFTDELAVPASWFVSDWVAETEQTEGGPYVRHSGLTGPGRLKFQRRAMFQVAEFKAAASIADEAAMYLLVNGGGTPQTDQDLQRARGMASQLP